MPDVQRTGPRPRPPSLGEAELHVWSASLDEPPVPREELRACLSREELTRSERFAFERLSIRFDVAHGLTRRILGAYLGRPPEQLEFAIGPDGKPSLAGNVSSVGELAFNLSHSDKHFLLGVAGGSEIGVDVERIKPLRDLSAIAGRFFSPGEAERLLSLPHDDRVRAFYECWTRKEAFVKAVGGGLQIPLDSFEVSFGPGRPAAFRTIDGSEPEAARWSLWGFDPAEGAIGAAAVRETGWSLVSLRWDRAPGT